MAHPNTRLPMPTSFNGNTPPFLEWTSEVRGFLQLNDFRFLVNLDTAFNEVNPVSLNDIYMLDIFETPVTVTPQQEISKTLNSSKIP